MSEDRRGNLVVLKGDGTLLVPDAGLIATVVISPAGGAGSGDRDGRSGETVILGPFDIPPGTRLRVDMGEPRAGAPDDEAIAGGTLLLEETDDD